jgi:hypothetical protein
MPFCRHISKGTEYSAVPKARAASGDYRRPIPTFSYCLGDHVIHAE